MFIYSLASLIPLTVLLALVVVSGRAIWLAVMPPRRCVKEASCEKCKYPVSGLSTWTCPECGSHLLTVGIVTRGMEMRRRGSYVRAIGRLLFLMFMAALILRAIVTALFAPYVGSVGNRSSSADDATMVFYSLLYVIPVLGMLLSALLVLQFVRRRRRLLREADQLLSRASVTS